MIAVSFVGSLALILAIGLWSARASRGTGRDYYLASSSVLPWLVGLSAVATNNSGYMFIGVMGYTYVAGLASVWLMVGWIVGDFLASLLVHRRLRDATARSRETSFAGVLARWHGERWPLWQTLAGLISLIFLLAYGAAQLVAGSKALLVLLDWPLWSGAVAGAVIVCLYSLAGGIRASIWTDAVQSAIMMCAMGVLLYAALAALGGPAAAWARMGAVPGFLDWFPRDTALPGAGGGALFALAWMFAGLSVVGQPHVMVRFMALDDPTQMWRVRGWYYGWFTLFYALATGVGLLSRVYLPASGFDAELALPMMALELLPPLLVGLVLAGIFAATMSTADSLILSCSSSITHDLLPADDGDRTRWPKLATVAVTLVALAIALGGNHSVFSLVLFAWSALASAFAPLLFVYAAGGRPRQGLAIAMLVVGVAVAVGWRALGWHDAVYEGMPGILAGLAVYALGRRAQPLAHPVTPAARTARTPPPR